MIRRISAAVLVAAGLATAQPASAHTLAARPAAGALKTATAFEGTLWLRHADDFSARRSIDEPMLALRDGTQLKLDFGRRAAPVAPGSRIRVKGVRQGAQLDVADGTTQTVAAATTSAASSAVTKRIAVVLVNFSNNATQPYTPATAAGVAFTNANSVAAYYRDNSWGSVTLTGDVYGWYTIPDTNTSCSYSTWGASARTVAASKGVDLNAYDNVVFAFPSTSACSWSGIANLPGRYSYLNGSGGMSLRTMAHELGHNFGTHHASSLSCTENGVRVSLLASTSSCTSSDYGDPFSIMGSSSRWHTNFSLGNFGWLQPENTQLVTTAGDYVIKPLEAFDPTGVQSLRIQRTTSSFLTLEFRQPGVSMFDAFALTDPVVNGVTVRVAAPYTTRTQSQLVDANPATTSFGDAPLAAGKTLTDPLTGVSITTLGVSSAGASVRVAFGSGGGSTPPADTLAPTAPGGLTATVGKAKKVTLSWSASSDDVGVAGYRIYRNGAMVAGVAGTSFTDTLGGKAGSATYYVVAYDAAGNVSPASTALTVRL